jgi:uncharacterized membrane protein
MTGWGGFALAMGLFLAAHSLPVRPPLRPWLVAHLGERGFQLGYSLLSLLLLAWLVVEAGRAPYVELWPFRPWQLWAPNLAMPMVILLLAASLGAPNPLSFGGGRADRFDPAHPGIAGVVRHPVLWALFLWSVSHLLPNGNLAHAILFGLFAAFSLAGMGMIDRQKMRQLGAAEWRRLAERTSAWPFEALLAGRWRPRLRHFPGRRLLVGTGLYALLLLAHRPIIGVSPIPLAL